MPYKYLTCGWEGDAPYVASQEPMENGLCWNYYVCPECKGERFEVDCKDTKGQNNG